LEAAVGLDRAAVDGRIKPVFRRLIGLIWFFGLRLSVRLWFLGIPVRLWFIGIPVRLGLSFRLPVRLRLRHGLRLIGLE